MLRVGGLGALGLSLPQLLAARQAQAASRVAGTIRPSGGKARSCIVLFLMGGPPQHSTWDPKPDAPAEVKGEIGPIATTVAGLQVGELMPGLAANAQRLAVLRAVSTRDNAHSSSGYYMLTGHPHLPMNAENANPGAPNNWPYFGAAVQQLTETPGDLPSCVRLPMHIFNTDGSIWPGQDGGFLARSSYPWLFRCEPASANYRIPEFSLPIEVPADRLLGRHSLLRQFNQQLDVAQRQGAIETYDGITQRAFDLLSSPQARQAFHLELESAETRERYGHSQFGQSCLLARRLVEAGVHLVHVNWFRGPDEPSDAPCWDSHARETKRLKEVLIPPWDRAFSALLEDLAARSMLEETLVVCMAEFGRTPRFNGNAGRDHWGPVFSIALGGGGVQGGIVHGASDRLGAYPKDGLVRPEDITATIFHCLGYSPDSTLRDPQGRDLAVSHGDVLHAIL
jgi:hypothetical protein